MVIVLDDCFYLLQSLMGFWLYRNRALLAIAARREVFEKSAFAIRYFGSQPRAPVISADPRTAIEQADDPEPSATSLHIDRIMKA